MWKKLSNKDFERFLTSAKDVAKLQELPNFQDILRGLNSAIIDRSRGCRVSRFRTYRDNMWTFRVNCSGTTYTVWLHAEDIDGNPNTLPELKIKCTCPHWKWGGPDFNANQGNYLYEKPFSNQSFPSQRDPILQNKLCKHSYAVLDKAKSFIIFESREQEKKRLQDKGRKDKVKLDREQRRKEMEERRKEQDIKKKDVQEERRLQDTERRRNQEVRKKDVEKRREENKRDRKKDKVEEKPSIDVPEKNTEENVFDKP